MADVVSTANDDFDRDLVCRLARECQIVAGKLTVVPHEQIPGLLREIALLIGNPSTVVGVVLVQHLIAGLVLQVRALMPSWRPEWDAHVVSCFAHSGSIRTTRRLLWQTISLLDGFAVRRRSVAELAPNADLKVFAALAAVRSQYHDGGFGLKSAADHVQLSPWHLDRLLRRHTGHSFVHHLRSARLAAAQALLTTTLLSVKEIAAKAGYNSVTHLGRDFRGHIGCSPTQWRQRLNGRVVARANDKKCR